VALQTQFLGAFNILFKKLGLLGQYLFALSYLSNLITQKLHLITINKENVF